MIKGNESLVEKINFYFLTPLSHNFKMLHFDANPITIRCPVTDYEGFYNAKNTYSSRITQEDIFCYIGTGRWAGGTTGRLATSRLLFSRYIGYGKNGLVLILRDLNQ